MAASKIAIQILDPRWKTLLKPYGKTVRDACGAALQKMSEMTVVLADDAFIRELNKTYRGKDKPTNVLAFPEGGSPQAGAYLGDLILALETVEREAKEQGKSFKEHTTHLLVHGTLHLLGYDHEGEKDAAHMEALEVKILKKLNVGNPYL